MNESLPWGLFFAYVVFYGLLFVHILHAGQFEGSSGVYLLALNSSVGIGHLVGLGLLVYYGIQTTWYWPFICSRLEALRASWLARLCALSWACCP